MLINLRGARYATFKKVWSEPDIRLSSASVSWDEYVSKCAIDRSTIINIMVGDLQRIKLYAKPPREFQIPQEVPDSVWAAYETLVKAGFVANLVSK